MYESFQAQCSSGATIEMLSAEFGHMQVGKCLKADIIITGVGKKDILRGDMVKKGAVVIDGGVCFVDGKMYGDVNVEEVLKNASHVTPTPGGVGPLTVAILLKNTIKFAEINMPVSK